MASDTSALPLWRRADVSHDEESRQAIQRPGEADGIHLHIQTFQSWTRPSSEKVPRLHLHRFNSYSSAYRSPRATFPPIPCPIMASNSGACARKVAISLPADPQHVVPYSRIIRVPTSTLSASTIKITDYEVEVSVSITQATRPSVHETGLVMLGNQMPSIAGGEIRTLRHI